MSLQGRIRIATGSLIAVVLATGALSGCTSEHALAGQACISSAQCAEGLLCDTTQTPAVCADKLGSRPNGFADASTGYDFAGLAGQDLSGVAPPDLASSAPDLATAPDLAQPDGG